jgi:hypothetical protein
LEYRIRLCSKIGQKRFDELEAKRHVTKKWTADELQQLIKEYKTKVRQLQ